jgi:hypothetical protein
MGVHVLPDVGECFIEELVAVAVEPERGLV